MTRSIRSLCMSNTAFGRALLQASLGLLVAIGLPCLAVAQQTFPDKPVRLFVGFPAGGPSDLLARIVAQKLSPYWKQPVIVENRPGASGTIAAAAVMRSAPDGYALAFGGSTAFVTYELLNPDKAPYKSFEAFEPVTYLADQANVMLVRASLKVNTLQEFVALAKSKPGALNFGSQGVGSPPHLNMELLKRAAGMDILTVPFGGSAPAIQALLGGTIDVIFNDPQSSTSLAKDGLTKLILVTDTKRLPEFPDVPTSRELGYDVAIKSWYAFFAPKGTPKAIVDKIDADTRLVLGTDEVSAVFAQAGFRRNLLDSKSFSALMVEQHAKVGALIKAANIKPQ